MKYTHMIALTAEHVEELRHLRVGTQKQNRADAVARGRVPSGMLHHSAKLSRSDVIEIRKRRANGEKLRHV